MSAAVHVHDRELLRRARAGDAEAFGAFYRARHTDVLAYIRVRVRSSELAADLMGETFARALLVVHDHYRELPAVPLAWLLTIARNELIDSVRRGRVADDTRRRLQLEPPKNPDQGTVGLGARASRAVGEIRKVRWRAFGQSRFVSVRGLGRRRAVPGSAAGGRWHFWLSGSAPLIVLVLVSAVSLGARAYRLDGPCVSPCTATSDHALINDESYYVNAGEVIAGIRPPRTLPAGQVGTYTNAPLGTDPNAEHPQGVKLVIAGAIELFGNGPFAWRIGSLLFGSLAILGMYALVRSAGGGRWLAVGAATLMAADPLMIVWGRIAFLDIYALAPVLWGVALYLRGRVFGAAALLAVAYCMKEASIFALLVIGLLEAFPLRLHRRQGHRTNPPPAASAWRPALARLGLVAIGSAALFIVGLWVMGLLAPPYSGDSGRQHLISGGPFGHLSYIINFAKAFSGSFGGNLQPWQWWYDHGAMTLLRVNPAQTGCHVPPDYPAGVTCLPGALPGLGPQAVRPVSVFLLIISPPILAFAIPALVICAVRTRRRRAGSRSRRDVDVGLLALAWTIGTWVPFELLNLVFHRISWLYYMVIVMPGVYVAVSHLACLLWRHQSRWLRGGLALYGLAVLAAAVVLYPFAAIF